MAKPNSEPARSADEQALLAAIIAHPDEDTPRLVYADWLDENAQPNRAEFIRAHIEVSRLPADDPNAKPFRTRVIDLVGQHREQWCEYRPAAFVRGLPTAVFTYNLYELLRGDKSLFSRHPIRAIYANSAFPETTEEEEAIISLPHFARLTALGSCSRGWGGHRVALVLQNPHLANLRMLDFYCGCYNRAEGARGIAAATHLSNLLVLDLSGNEIGNEGLETLAGAKHLASLRALRLGKALSDGANDITADGIAAFARSKCIPSLTQLALDGNTVGADGVELLLQANWGGNLTELNLADSEISERGLLTLARSGRLTNLRRLDVAANEVTEAVAWAFLQSQSFPNLKDLHLIGNHRLEQPLTEATQAALRQRFGPGVIGERTYHSYGAPTPLCLEEKIRWRMISDDPPDPDQDCEAV